MTTKTVKDTLRIKRVLDRGYVRLVDVMGSDLTPVNAARVSFDKQSYEMTERDERLIKFLAREGHTSPFRHAVLQFEVYAPLMVARQWWKYRIGAATLEPVDIDALEAWNESSRRYITEEPAFYVPQANEWRSAPENRKQGSGEPVSSEIGAEAVARLLALIDEAQGHYEWALENGICAEQARLFLPAYGMYVRWYWTASLQAVAHFLNQRLADDAQKEIQAYAKAVYEWTKEQFPIAVSELVSVDENKL